MAAGQDAYISGSDTAVNFTVTFDKDVNAGEATTAAKYALTDTSNAAFAGGTLTVTASTLKVYNFKADVGAGNGASNDGVITFSVPAGGIHDSTGNNTNAASATPATITVYGTNAAVSSAVIVTGTTNTIDVTFNHDMAKASVENAAAYGVAGQTITSATQQADLKVVRLVTDAADLAGKSLTVVNATDMAGNAMAAPATVNNLAYPAPKVAAVHRTSGTSIDLTFDLTLDGATVVPAGFTGLLAGGGANNPTAATLDATKKVVTLTLPASGDDGSVTVVNTVKSTDGQASAGETVKLYLADGITFTEVDAKTVTVDFGTMYARA